MYILYMLLCSVGVVRGKCLVSFQSRLFISPHLWAHKLTPQRRGTNMCAANPCISRCFSRLHKFPTLSLNRNTKYFLPCSFINVFLLLQVNLAIMQKQLSEMAIGHPRQSASGSRQNGFSGGVGALGIMNNRLAETSVDRSENRLNPF